MKARSLSWMYLVLDGIVRRICIKSCAIFLIGASRGKAKSPVKQFNLHLFDGIPALGLSHSKGIKVRIFYLFPVTMSCSFPCNPIICTCRRTNLMNLYKTNNSSVKMCVQIDVPSKSGNQNRTICDVKGGRINSTLVI